jgi:hypothetical protein
MSAHSRKRTFGSVIVVSAKGGASDCCTLADLRTCSKPEGRQVDFANSGRFTMQSPSPL